MIRQLEEVSRVSIVDTTKQFAERVTLTNLKGERFTQLLPYNEYDPRIYLFKVRQ
jgi:hypothetical protein